MLDQITSVIFTSAYAEEVCSAASPTKPSLESALRTRTVASDRVSITPPADVAANAIDAFESAVELITLLAVSRLSSQRRVVFTDTMFGTVGLHGADGVIPRLATPRLIGPLTKDSREVAGRALNSSVDDALLLLVA